MYNVDFNIIFIIKNKLKKINIFKNVNLKK